MLKALFSVVILFCFAAFCSCQKEIDSINETPLDTTDLPASESYLPTTAGTFWVYRDSSLDGNDTATVLGETWLYNNVNFKKVQTEGISGESFSYFGYKDNDYFLYGDQDGTTVTMLVLNDAKGVGETWTYDMGMINNVPARGTGTIVEKNISYTVEGKTYQNVIHSQYVIALSIAGNYVPLVTNDFYFAKGVGIIKLMIADVTSGTADAQYLVNYEIK